MGQDKFSLRPSGRLTKTKPAHGPASEQLCPAVQQAKILFFATLPPGLQHDAGTDAHDARCRCRKEQDLTYLSHRVDVDVVLCVLGVRHEGLDQELPQDAVDSLHALDLAGSRLDPLTGLLPCLVQRQQTALASPLDQLVGLCDELGAGGQQPRVGGLGLVEDALDVGTLGKVQRGELGGWVVCGGGGQRGGLDDRGTGEVVVDDGLAVGLEDGFGGHVA